MVLHAQPTLYTLDGLTGVRKPLGLHADRLGVDIHVVLADGSPLRNLDMCVRSAHLEVNSIVARSEEHTSELQSLMRISYAVFCLKKKKQHEIKKTNERQ